MIIKRAANQLVERKVTVNTNVSDIHGTCISHLIVEKFISEWHIFSLAIFFFFFRKSLFSLHFFVLCIYLALCFLFQATKRWFIVICAKYTISIKSIKVCECVILKSITFRFFVSFSQQISWLFLVCRIFGRHSYKHRIGFEMATIVF